MASTLPNFFIIGAPKCGTTTLASWLSEHPQIYMSVPKEPHFFCTDLKNRNITTWRDYYALFQFTLGNPKIVGEASTWYLYSRDAVPGIEKSCINPLYIVMTRDPVEMVRSLYEHNVRHLHEDAKTLEEAWDLQACRASGHNLPRGIKEPAFLQYRDACALGSLLKRLLEHVGRNRILHVPLSALQHDPQTAYEEVLSFLGVEIDKRYSFDSKNVARGYRSKTLQEVLIRLAQVKRLLRIRKNFGVLRMNEVARAKEQLPAPVWSKIHHELSSEIQLLDKLVESGAIGTVKLRRSEL